MADSVGGSGVLPGNGVVHISPQASGVTRGYPNRQLYLPNFSNQALELTLC